MDRLTEMEAFATVVDQGGFTDAARKMGISKSDVSKHISSLETRLGARLLNRTTRRVSPTEIGLAYYDRARRVLNDAGEMEDSSLRARKIAETTIRMVASPGYLQRAGRPRRIEDLGAHKLLHYTNQANGAVWKMTSQTGEKRQIRKTGSFTVNDGQSLLKAAINGLGIAYLPSFLYASALAEGRVVDVMPELPKETQGIYVVYPPGKFTQPKVRAFIDYLAQTFARKGPDHW